jgi:hypothetical protein
MHYRATTTESCQFWITAAEGYKDVVQGDECGRSAEFQRNCSKSG